MPRPCIHFIAFDPKRDSQRWANAAVIWGPPDFIHRVWDYRARAELMPGDVAIFAHGLDSDPPTVYSYDDSSHQ